MTEMTDEYGVNNREIWAEPEIISLNTRHSEIFPKFGADGSALSDSTKS